MRTSPTPPKEGLFITRRPRYLDVYTLADDVRREDALEWSRSTGGEPFADTLHDVVKYDPPGLREAIVLAETNRCICMWGVDVPNAAQAKALMQQGFDPSTTGIGWMVASNEALKWALDLHRLLSTRLADIDTRFETVWAMADADNTVHHKWMEWMGFTLHSTVGVFPTEQAPARGEGVEHYPFYIYIRRRPT